jgi:predicted dehydrogenase
MKKIRYGMLGGASDAFFGAVHRMAMQLDGHYEPVCGCFSRNMDKSKTTGEQLNLDPKRIYANVESMIEAESALPESERMQLLVIVTPNDQHFGPAMQALKAGFHVSCDKPVTMTSEEAIQLKNQVEASGKSFLLTHTYAGYPMIRESRELIREGKLGKIRRATIEYPQGWLSASIEKENPIWRLDPKRSGIVCCMGDIGTHAAHMLNFVTGKKIESLAAELNSFGDGRVLDDDGSMIIRMEDGIRGFLAASQIATGDENELRFKISGTKATIEWLQSEPNTLWFKPLEGPIQKLKAGTGYLSEAAKTHCRLPAGHPEGFIEALGNLYRNLALDIRFREGITTSYDAKMYDYPGIDDGIMGMKFIEATVASSRANAGWTKL